ncbi:type VI secretion system baseplate subunit TssF [Thioclava sp. GXIMD4216]|uniref:type VI secretion system baseplate subunit TssF n=1 Tax=Thioclava sp. GXIMD4216 TaxID=3131929 RepID=UPI0030CE837D
MNRAFRDAYNRELALLKERTAEFAADYPGLADRLGGLLAENLDPTVAGLLEGSAFLAARVQLKIDEEFKTFTETLLEQIFPQALAPVPSVLLAEASIPADASAITEGLRFAPGAYMDARFRDADRRIACRFTLAAPLTIWPIALTGVTYHGGAGPIGALGQEPHSDTRAGLVLDLARVGTNGLTDGSAPLAELAMDRLDLHLTGPMAEACALYEQLLADTTRTSLRWLDGNGDACFARLPKEALEQGGFDLDERLLPHHDRLFDGYALLREFFIFPRKFLNLRLTGLAAYLKRLPGSELQVIFEFDQPNGRLAQRLGRRDLALHCVPAVNLFEEMASTVRVDERHSEFVVMPNSTPMTHYEIHAITGVQAHFASLQSKADVLPLYAQPEGGTDPRQSYYYTSRRKQRRLTAKERRLGMQRSQYRGTETFISIYEPPGQEEVQRLQVKALASNRHLAESLPIAESRDDFTLNDDQSVTLGVRSGPSAPRYPLAQDATLAGVRGQEGHVYWRLISFLSLNQFGLSGQGREDGAAALREILSVFANHADPAARAAVAGVTHLATRPITRTVAMADGFHAARGLEVTLTFNDDDYEGSGPILIGAVLDRFLAEYAAVNAFTQVRIETRQRGHILTFPPRTGRGPLL